VLKGKDAYLIKFTSSFCEQCGDYKSLEQVNPRPFGS
jgi:hypothetical protein